MAAAVIRSLPVSLDAVSLFLFGTCVVDRGGGLRFCKAYNWHGSQAIRR
jgi:hypothetical protein